LKTRYTVRYRNSLSMIMQESLPEITDLVTPLIVIEVFCSGDPRYLQLKPNRLMVPTYGSAPDSQPTISNQK